MKRYLIPFVALLASCSAPDKITPGQFFDIDSLVTKQVELLSEGKFKLQKKVVIGVSNEQAALTPDSLQWSSELDVFRQLAIAGRPTNRDKYEISDIEDTRSNLRIRSYAAEKTPVPELKIYYLNGIGDVRKIEATYYESNLLYTSQRNLELEFEGGNARGLIRQYKVEGYQKIIMSDSVHFLIEANVVL